MTDKIYVVAHKKISLTPVLKNKGYEIITVGEHNFTNDGVNDSDGKDNISKKNKNYCELTAAYWIWKNVDADIKGFCHYRRFLTNECYKFREDKVLSISEVRDILSSNPRSVIVPERKYYNTDSKTLYLKCGYEKDLRTVRSVIEKLYPDYLDCYDDMLIKNTGYVTNIIIAKKDIYDRYCTWLFDILFEVEKRTNLIGYSKEEARIYGYISERLLDVWLKVNNIETFEYESINTETDCGIKFMVYRLFTRIGIYKIYKNMLWKINELFKIRQ